MARLVQLNNPHPDLPVFFNVDAPVGNAPAANKAEDVLLVQFLLTAGARTSKVGQYPQLAAALKAVRTTGHCDQATIAAITSVQEYRQKKQISKGDYGKVVDGRVSPARDYIYGKYQYTIISLNELIQNNNMDVWPRIDKLKGFPQGLMPMMKRWVIGR